MASQPSTLSIPSPKTNLFAPERWPAIKMSVELVIQALEEGKKVNSSWGFLNLFWREVDCPAPPGAEKLQADARVLFMKLSNLVNRYELALASGNDNHKPPPSIEKSDPDPAPLPTLMIADPVHPPEAPGGPLEEQDTLNAPNRPQPPPLESTSVKGKYDLRATLQLVDDYLDNFPGAVSPAHDLVKVAVLTGYRQGLMLCKRL